MVASESERGALTIAVAEDAGDHLVTLSGELDLLHVATLRHRLEALLVEGSAQLVIDLRGLAFIDSSGLGALVAVHKKAKVLRGGIALVVEEGPVDRLLTLTGMRHVLRVFVTVEDALREARAARRR
ncbi:STAS domain-containing protein [Nocardioides sp. BP30]|uniref:STAS domain-containing protein n=1 Tax=Nocardioides sp. BP30 TaxID=3036374 RepID=UPI0024696FF2|nr:STAS domain-containing protein [Nocardioides sp. BP30]WGL50558.1 STAS domain-containing protein [Nocardioides sp. BP30]